MSFQALQVSMAGAAARTSLQRKTDAVRVSVVVPCYNEEATVVGTIASLKALNYPQDKLSIIAIDDGSTDDTWSYLQRYEYDPQISIYHKENGGKHTALNAGIAATDAEIDAFLSL